MSEDRRGIRLFVSSTYLDFREERRALHEYVFPSLSKLCSRLGVPFEAIDLRWGVSEEAQRHRRSVSICLNEARRCRHTSWVPNFLLLLGNRCGWRPAAEEIPQDEFEAIMTGLSSAPGDKSRCDLIDGSYSLDRNAVGPVYRLRAQLPMEKERDLAKALRAASRRLRLSRRRRLQYEASITEQETEVALGREFGRDEIFCFTRTIRGLPRTLDAAWYRDLDENQMVDQEAESRLKRLKQRLRALGQCQWHSYQAEWSSTRMSLGYLEVFCSRVEKALSRAILETAKDPRRGGRARRERAGHEAFAREQAREFVGRRRDLKRVLSYLVRGDPHPLVVVGRAGSGKTSFLAKVVEECRRRFPRWAVVYRSIGVTPQSFQGEHLLQGLQDELRSWYGRRRDRSRLGPISPHRPESPGQEKFSEIGLSKCIKWAHAGKPLLLVLDALDQIALDDPARSLVWLPWPLPPYARIVVSALDPKDGGEILRRLPLPNRLSLSPMATVEARILLETWLAEARRTLQPEQKLRLLSAFARRRLPLFLRIAFQEARRWSSKEKPPQLGGDVQTVARRLFRRLSDAREHGRVFVERCLTYLAAGRHGLTEKELKDLLWRDPAVRATLAVRFARAPDIGRLPDVVWSRLHDDLVDYLTQRNSGSGPRIDWFHRELSRVVANTYLPGRRARNRHRQVAAYFREQSLGAAAESGFVPNLRKLEEYPYQLHGAQFSRELCKTIADPGFLDAKVHAIGAYAVKDDFDLGLHPRGGARPPLRSRKNLELLQLALVKSADVLGRHPTQLRSQLEGRLAVTPWSRIKGLPGAGPRSGETAYLQPLTRSLKGPDDPFLARLSGHHDIIWSVAVSPDGKLAATGDIGGTLCFWDLEELVRLAVRSLEEPVNALAVTPDGRRLISGHVGNVRLWDMEAAQELSSFRVHSKRVTSIAIFPDGRTGISSSADGTILIWNLDPPHRVRVLGRHRDIVEEVTVAPDGRTAASASFDGSVKLWDVVSGRLRRVLAGHESHVTAVAFSPDGRRILSGTAPLDNQLRLWDVKTGRLLRTFSGHANSIRSIAVAPDGHTAVTASADHTLKVWNLGRSTARTTLSGHSKGVNACALLQGGRRIISVSEDAEVRTWKLQKGSRPPVPHSQPVRALSLAPDGRQVLSVFWDGTVKVWDSATGRLLRTLAKAQESAGDLVVSSDGRWAAMEAFSEEMTLWNLKSGSKQSFGERGGDRRRLLAFAADGHLLVSNEASRELTAFDPSTATELWASHRSRVAISALAIASRENIALTGTDTGALRLWDVNGGRLLRVLSGHEGEVTQIVFMKDGQHALSASADRTVRVWNLQRRRPERVLRGHRAAVRALALIPGAQRIITAGDDRKVRVWDLRTGRELGQMSGSGLALFPGGEHVATVSESDTVNVWGLRRFQEVASFSGDGILTSFLVAPASGTLVLGEATGSLHFLRLQGI